MLREAGRGNDLCPEGHGPAVRVARTSGMNRSLSFFGIALVLLLPLFACGGGGSSSSTPPTFTQVYTDVLGPQCGTQCHNPGGIGFTEGMLDMSTQSLAFDNLVNVPAAGSACAGKGVRVAPGMPDGSIMYLKASDEDPAPCGAKMPFGSNGLPSAQSDEVKAWITAGAPND
jgi:hypothetical protein